MRQVILVFAVLAVIAIGVIAFTGPGETRVRARPLVGIVHGPNGLIYQVKDSDYALAVSLPKDWLEQSQGNSSGGKTYNANATFVSRRGRLTATVMRNSYTPAIASINGISYDLSQGSVFRVRLAKPVETKEGDANEDSSGTNNLPSTGVEVIQLPFAPLDVTPTYVEELNEYLKDRGLD
jgi:hypothetical protein